MARKLVGDAGQLPEHDSRSSDLDQAVQSETGRLRPNGRELRLRRARRYREGSRGVASSSLRPWAKSLLESQAYPGGRGLILPGAVGGVEEV